MSRFVQCLFGFYDLSKYLYLSQVVYNKIDCDFSPRICYSIDTDKAASLQATATEADCQSIGSVGGLGCYTYDSASPVLVPFTQLAVPAPTTPFQCMEFFDASYDGAAWTSPSPGNACGSGRVWVDSVLLKVIPCPNINQCAFSNGYCEQGFPCTDAIDSVFDQIDRTCAACHKDCATCDAANGRECTSCYTDACNFPV